MSAPSSKLTLAATALVAVVATAAVIWFTAPEPARPAVRKLNIPVDSPVREQSISPNGKIVAYRTGDTLYLRPLDITEAIAIPDTGGADHHAWSPDSQWLSFHKDEQLWKVPATGGTPQTLGSVAGAFNRAGGVGWTPSGDLIFTSGDDRGLWTMSARGGEEREILAQIAETENDFHDATVLPDGRGAIFVVHRITDSQGNDTIAVWDGTERKDILQIPEANFRDPSYDPSGHIVYSRIENNIGIWAAPFSLDDLEITGEPFLVVPRGRQPRTSREGTLTYLTGAGTGVPQTQLVWVDRSGGALGPIGEPATFSPFMALSPDDSRVAIAVQDDDGQDLWIYDSVRETRTRLTFADRSSPSWSGDGADVYYNGAEDGDSVIYAKKADGSGEPRRLTLGFSPSISPDGNWLWFNRLNPFALWTLDLQTPDAEPSAVQEGAMHARLSPNGTYLAWSAPDGSGTRQVYLASFPDMTGKRQVSVDGGRYSRWRADGRELFFIGGNRSDIMAVAVESESPLTLGNPQRLFTRTPSGIPNRFNSPDDFLVSSDGQRFVIVEPLPGAVASQTSPITVVTNWFEEFRQD